MLQYLIELSDKIIINLYNIDFIILLHPSTNIETKLYEINLTDNKCIQATDKDYNSVLEGAKIIGLDLFELQDSELFNPFNINFILYDKHPLFNMESCIYEINFKGGNSLGIPHSDYVRFKKYGDIKNEL